MDKILVIDDDAGMGSIFKRLLRRRAEVVSCTRAQAALDLLEEQEFSAILCDLNMPSMSGVEFYRAMENQGLDTDRLAFVTGGALAGEDQVFIEATDNPVLYKPFGIKELYSVVDQMLADDA